MAEDRKARLAALAARAGKFGRTNENTDENKQHAESAIAEQAEENEPSSKRVRSDDPETQLPSAEEGDGAKALEIALAKAQAESAAVSADNLIAVATKKINWDLKRDIQPKLDKLERKTQKAIVEILRARLEHEAEVD